MIDFTNWENRLYPSLVANIDYICTNIPINGVLYDIGANTGLLSLKVLEQRPDISIVLFEPVKRYYDSILKKFENRSNVKAYNIALFDVNTELEISIDNNNLGWNTLKVLADYGEKEKVIARRLYDLFVEENLSLPDMIKIDVEKSEFLIIEGARPLLDKHIPEKMVMEIGITKNDYYWPNEVYMMEYLFSLGYKRFDYEKNSENTYDAKFELI